MAEEPKEYRCKFEKNCSTLRDMLDLITYLKDKKDLLFDYTTIRAAYEVFLKHHCNDVNLCKKCSRYKSLEQEGKPSEVVNRITFTSGDDEEFDPDWKG